MSQDTRNCVDVISIFLKVLLNYNWSTYGITNYLRSFLYHLYWHASFL